jgi:hypothetical protein
VSTTGEVKIVSGSQTLDTTRTPNLVWPKELAVYSRTTKKCQAADELTALALAGSKENQKINQCLSKNGASKS